MGKDAGWVAGGIEIEREEPHEQERQMNMRLKKSGDGLVSKDKPSQAKLSEEATWRAKAKVIVAEVMSRCEGQPDKQLLKELKDAYPFGSRTPARVWGAEVSRQRKLRKQYNDPRQVKLFEDA